MLPSCGLREFQPFVSHGQRSSRSMTTTPTENSRPPQWLFQSRLGHSQNLYSSSPSKSLRPSDSVSDPTLKKQPHFLTLSCWRTVSHVETTVTGTSNPDNNENQGIWWISCAQILLKIVVWGQYSAFYCEKCRGLLWRLHASWEEEVTSQNNFWATVRSHLYR